jgi:hypothetical protein
VAKANGFSLHAGVSCEGHQKEKRGKSVKPTSNKEARLPTERHAAMTWAQRLNLEKSVNLSLMVSKSRNHLNYIEIRHAEAEYVGAPIG